MKRHPLGSTGIEASQMGYGLGSFGSAIPYETGADLLDRFRAAGGNFLDTAHIYAAWVQGGLGVSERFLGRYLRERGREGWIVTTKGGHVGLGFYPRPDNFMAPELVRQDLAESLERLGLDQVDLYSYHRDDERIPVEELVDAAHEIVASGEARAFGVSNWSLRRAKAAKAYAARAGKTPFVVLQNQWSLAEPDWTGEKPGCTRAVRPADLPGLRQTGLVVAAYSSTAKGFFATATPKSRSFTSDTNARRKERATRLATERGGGVTTNQVALAWLLAQDVPTIPLLGTGNTDHLHDALEALKLTLTSAERDWLRDG